MPLVHVEDGGLVAQRFESAHAADAEHDLLADSHVVVAAIKLAGDAAIFRPRILGRIGIEEQHLHAADSHRPDADRDRPRGQLQP